MAVVAIASARAGSAGTRLPEAGTQRHPKRLDPISRAYTRSGKNVDGISGILYSLGFGLTERLQKANQVIDFGHHLANLEFHHILFIRP